MTTKNNATDNISTKDMTRSEWLELRRSYIGGSDAGVILGVNKWKTKTQLFFEKVDPTTVEEIDNEYIYWGNVLEDVVAKEFERRTGKKVRKSNKFYVHPEHPFMSGNVDRLVVGERALLECKTTSEFGKNDWQDDDVPASYLIQVQHYLAVTGLDTAYIAVLIGGNKFVWKEIKRDDELIEIIITQEKDFWENHVQAGVIPEIDGSASTGDFLNRMFKDIDHDDISLGDDTEIMLDAIESIDNEIKTLTERRDAYKNKIKFSMAEHEKASTNGYIVTWKRQTTKRIDTKRVKEKFGAQQLDDCYKESETRVFKIKKVKGE